jgi:hypothetical protein
MERFCVECFLTHTVSEEREHSEPCAHCHGAHKTCQHARIQGLVIAYADAAQSAAEREIRARIKEQAEYVKTATDKLRTVVGFARTNGDTYIHAVTGRKTLCDTFAVEAVAGPADCPDCTHIVQEQLDDVRHALAEIAADAKSLPPER